MKVNESNNSNKTFTDVSKQTGFSKLISSIKGRFFTPPPPALDPEIKLKVSKIDGDASNILKHLIAAKIRFQQKLDTETYGHLVRILDPLAQDVKKMSGLLDKAQKTEELSQVLERYQAWMSKAKNWIGLERENSHSDDIVQGIVEHMLGELNLSIDRDIRSILNYMNQIIQSEASDSDQSEKEKIFTTIEPHIGALNALKERKIRPELERFTEWKRWVNARRSVLFENALLVLDEYKIK